MSTRARFLAGAAAGAGAAAALPASAQFAPQLSIAVMCPLSGTDRASGEQLLAGVRAALDDANRTRSLADRSYTVKTFDDENTIAGAMLNANFATDDQTQSAAIGHLSGKATDYTLRAYAGASMPLIVPGSSYDAITSHGYRNVFRLPTKDSVEGQLHAKYVLREGRGRNIAVLFQDGDYGFDVANGFITQARSDKLTAAEHRFAWEKPNFPAVAQEVVASAPDLVFLAGIARDMGPVVPALRAAGYKGPFSASRGSSTAVSPPRTAKSSKGSWSRPRCRRLTSRRPPTGSRTTTNPDTAR